LIRPRPAGFEVTGDSTIRRSNTWHGAPACLLSAFVLFSKRAGGWRVGSPHGARPVDQKKILFRDDPRASKAEQIAIQVKGGKTGVKDVRDLCGVLNREKAAIGVLISLQSPTRDMVAQAVSAGFYEHKTNKQSSLVCSCGR